ncbi:unnamed protein product, partial [Rotaria sp. Silwood1]
ERQLRPHVVGVCHEILGIYLNQENAAVQCFIGITNALSKDPKVAADPKIQEHVNKISQALPALKALPSSDLDERKPLIDNIIKETTALGERADELNPHGPTAKAARTFGKVMIGLKYTLIAVGLVVAACTIVLPIAALGFVVLAKK